MGVLAPALLDALKRYNKETTIKNENVFNEIQGYPIFDDDDWQYLFTTSILMLMRKQFGKKEVIAVGEKTPENILVLPILIHLFKGAKFINVVRDGRDAAISGWYHNLRTNPDWLSENGLSLENYIRSYAELWSRDLGLATSFAEIQPERCMTLRYEDLLDAPKPTLKAALGFLGVDTTANDIAACCAASSFSVLSKGRSQGQEDQTSFFRKGTRGDWRNHFTPAMEAVFKELAGTWLERFGYDC